MNVVMELCGGGELFDRIIAQGYYSERVVADLCRHIVNVVHHCHFMRVLHRDLKPENFLLSSKGDKAMLEATDSGLSVFVEEEKLYHDLVGSAYYVALEVSKQSYGKEIEVWSARVILYILLSGVPLFWVETEKGIFDAILKENVDFNRQPWPSISKSDELNSGNITKNIFISKIDALVANFLDVDPCSYGLVHYATVALFDWSEQITMVEELASKLFGDPRGRGSFEGGRNVMNMEIKEIRANDLGQGTTSWGASILLVRRSAWNITIHGADATVFTMADS